MEKKFWFYNGHGFLDLRVVVVSFKDFKYIKLSLAPKSDC